MLRRPRAEPPLDPFGLARLQVDSGPLRAARAGLTVSAGHCRGVETWVRPRCWPRPAVSRAADPPGRRRHRAAGGGIRDFSSQLLAASRPPAVRGRPRNRPRPRNRRAGVEVPRLRPAGTDSPLARLAVGGHGPCPARLRQADRTPAGALRAGQPDLDARVAVALPFALAIEAPDDHRPNFGEVTDVDAAAGLPVDAGNPQPVDPAAPRFWPIADERRWRAARAAGLASVPATIRFADAAPGAGAGRSGKQPGPGR